MARSQGLRAPTDESLRWRSTWRSRLALSLVATLGSWLVRVLGATWRVEVHGTDFEAERRRGASARGVHAFWHRSILAVAAHYRGRNHCVVISEHRDGEIIARIAQRLGFLTARGSSTRGGSRALREILSLLEQGCGDIALTPDGPRGPAEVLKRGVVYCAVLTGLPMVPVGVAADSCWRFGSWDRFEVPKPFARINVFLGAPIAMEEDPTPEAIERARQRMQSAMEAAYAEAHRRLDRRGGATMPSGWDRTAQEIS